MVLSVDPVTGVGSADVPSANGAQEAPVVSGSRVMQKQYGLYLRDRDNP